MTVLRTCTVKVWLDVAAACGPSVDWIAQRAAARAMDENTESFFRDNDRCVGERRFNPPAPTGRALSESVEG